MPTIHQLSPSVINKIAAGEVIERPASVVKELLENSVDAHASRIEVSVNKGGAELIRVSDDGHGITSDQLTLAVASHATSKIQDADDLFQVGTLGFRGEALASIAEISRFSIQSRTPDDSGGMRLEVLAGKTEEVAPCGCPVGTTIEVSDLFMNTPVRRKFLRTTQTEMGHIGEAFIRIALAHPQIHFSLRHNNRLLHDLPPTTNWLDRIATLFSKELAENLIQVESTDNDVRLAGYVAHPSQSRGNQRMQYLFLNGRHIRDRSLQHALGEAYRGLLLTGRFPITFLSLEMPPEGVDVNVHPTKLEVRFRDGSKLYSQLLGTLRTKFLSTNLETRLHAPESIESDTSHDLAAAATIKQEMVAWAQGRPDVTVDSPPSPHAGSFSSSPQSRQPLILNKLDESWRTSVGGSPSSESHGLESPGLRADQAEPVRSRLAEADQSQLAPADKAGALQIHNRYLVSETDDGMVVIDQHALHERILYEQLRNTIATKSLEMQKLLVPEPVDLGSAEVATILDHRELLLKLGIDIEPFGGDTVLIVGYPAMLANLQPTEMLHALVDQLMTEGKSPETRDLIDELLHMMSCKAAIKAGDRLNPEEISALLEQRHLVQDTHHCPHGRPTALVLTREELDKQFKRT